MCADALRARIIQLEERGGVPTVSDGDMYAALATCSETHDRGG